MSDPKIQHGSGDLKGWLFKWTNYLKGYQRRWFVLSNGHLSYYRHPAEISHTCRGSISLHGALIHVVDACTFIVSNGATQTFHIKASTEVERQQWVTALELAKAKAIQALESEEEEEEYQGNANQKMEQVSTLKDLSERLEHLQSCYELLVKKGSNLQKCITDLETQEPVSHELSTKVKSLTERATLFRVAATAMISASSDYLQLAQQQEPKWRKMVQHERDQKERIEKMVEQLARQHSHLEEAAQHALPDSLIEHQMEGEKQVRIRKLLPQSDDDEDNAVFYDAQETDPVSLAILNSLSRGRDRTDSQGSDDGSSSECDPTVTADRTRNDNFLIVTDYESLPNSRLKALELDKTPWRANNGSSSAGITTTMPKRKRRTRVPDKPNYPLNLWSIMKNSIGKELSKIPMPVNFSEPLSMLQRLAEDYEYAHILDRAAECTDKYEQMAYIAAFTVSSYSTTANRTGKPFNPLLGETYECDRTDDLGWRSISEQVSHHPPMVAQYCEGRKWRCWQEFTMASKFRGKYLQVIPLGTAHLEFNSNSQHYTWRKVTTTVHNIIVGKLWVDQSGDMDIINHTDGIKCHLKYTPYSYFSRDSQRKVKGVVMNTNTKEVKWVVQGTWDTKIEIAQVTNTTGTPDNPVYKTGPYILAWKRHMPPPDSEKFYNFTELACQLNEPEEGIAPTDSRLRPDQRLMEDGLWEEANTEKLRLEEKQRAVRRARENEAEKATDQGMPYESYEPLWFKKQEDPFTDSLCHMYTGEYWECKNKQDWSRCPNIF
ncbi:oxysterol-binding protein 1 isoform X2 [Leptopilina heterotoma]|uniref:oxysterol-binding protein 1 isoform X2 n=1 Tax=Leptopilina heterotoma TaxID=63436 RepID=UPI001CA93864|nr:oxysterol-binding protein 1 isoform X2 [Leptopilina heterotoma]